MPVRSFNLKLVVPRGSDDRMLRQALWTTHAEVNAATKYYEAPTQHSCHQAQSSG